MWSPGFVTLTQFPTGTKVGHRARGPRVAEKTQSSIAAVVRGSFLAVYGFVCLHMPQPAIGQEALPANFAPFSLPAATLLHAASSPVARDEYPLVVLHDSQRFDFDERQRLTRVSHQIYRVDSALAVVASGEVRAIWDPSRQSQPTIRARVVSQDGREHLFDSSLLSDESAPGGDSRLFDDTRLLRGPLPAISIGSIVEIETVIVDQEPPFDAGRLQRVFIGASGAVQQTSIMVSAPMTMPVRYSTRLLPEAKISTQTRDGRMEIALRHGPVAIGWAQRFAEATGNQPVIPEFQFSTGESWSLVAAGYEALAAPFIRPEEVRSLLPTPLSPDRDELIANLLDILHERIRYTGVLFGQGKIIPNPPSITLERRFGDCKDKAIVLVSLLRAAGIQSQLALIRADLGVDVDPSLPGIEGFNHMLVHVPGERPLWIDPTIDHARAGELPLEDADRWALLIGQAAEQLVKTPHVEPSDEQTLEVIEIRLAEFGKAELHVQGRLKGTSAMRLRQTWSSTDTVNLDDRDKLLKDLYLVDSIKQFEIGKDRPEGFQTYELQATGAQVADTDIGNAVVKVALWDLFTGFPVGLRLQVEDPEKIKAQSNVSETGAAPPRTLDWIFRPFISERQFKVLRPVGFKFKTLPENRNLSFGPALFTQSLNIDPSGDLVVTARVDAGRGRYSADEGREFHENFLANESDLNLEIWLEHEAVTMMTEGDEAASLRRHAELISAEPNKAIHRIRAAMQMVKVGLVQSARAQALVATQIEPNNSTAFRVLGIVLEHDELGRQYMPGFDRAGAIRAYQKSILLAPAQLFVFGNLARVAEYNNEGVRFGPGADLDLAISSYRKELAVRPDWHEGKKWLMQCLLQARRFGEAVAVAADTPADESLAPHRLAARVMIIGAAATLREDAALGNSGTREKRLKDALDVLWQARFYDVARELTEKSGVSLQDERYAYWTRLLEKTVEEETMPSPPETASGVAETVLRLAMRREADRKVLKPWLSERARANAEAELLIDSLTELGRETTAEIGWYYGYNPVLIRDVILSNLEFKEAAITSNARRVSVQFSGRLLASLYMLSEEKGWRLMSIAPSWHLIGREVLAQLASGDLPTARAWLESVRGDIDDRAGENPDPLDLFVRAVPHDRPDMDESSMWLAAHVLLVRHGVKFTSVDEMIDASSVPATDEQRAIWQTLIYLAAKSRPDPELAVSAAESAFAANPSYEYAQWLLANAYEMAGRWKDSERVSREWLAARPSDESAPLALTRALNGQNRSKEGLEVMAQPVRRGRASPRQLGQFAWQAFYAAAVDSYAVTAAETAYGKFDRSNSWPAYTLACLYAATGRIADARRLMFEMLANGIDLDMYSNEVWLLRGLIAEQLGANDEAVSAYEKVEKPKFGELRDDYNVAIARRLNLVGK